MGPRSWALSIMGSASVRGVAAPILSALFFLSMFFVPVLGSLINPFAPLPILYVLLRYGLVAGLFGALLSAIVVGAVLGAKVSAFYLLSYALMAMVLGGMIKKQVGITTAVAVAAALSMAATGLFFVAVGSSSAAEVYTFMLKIVQQMINESVDTYRKAGVPADQVDFLVQNAGDISRWMVRILPGAAAVAYFLMSLSNYIFYRYLQKRWTYLAPADTLDTTRWSPPEQMVFAFILGLGLALVANSLARIVGVNILIVVMLVYFTTGCCIIQFWFEKFKLPNFLRMTVYILLLLQPFLMAGIAGMGLFDLWFDFRKIRRKAGAKEEDNGTDT